MEAHAVEAQLVAEMDEAMRTHPPGDNTPAVAVEVRTEGTSPDTELVILFRCPAKSGALYGYRLPIWGDEGLASDADVEWLVTSVYLAIHETLMTELGLPRAVEVDSGGVAWIRLGV
jgi:hypothetical protein